MKRAVLTPVLGTLLAIPVAPAHGAAATQRPPQITDAKAWIVIDARDGAALSSRAPNLRLPIASTTRRAAAGRSADARDLEPSGAARLTRVEAPEEVDGPIRQGERIGSVSVSVDGRQAGIVPLVAERSVSAVSLPRKAAEAVRSRLIIVVLGLIVIVVAVLLARRGGYRRPGRTGGGA